MIVGGFARDKKRERDKERTKTREMEWRAVAEKRKRERGRGREGVTRRKEGVFCFVFFDITFFSLAFLPCPFFWFFRIDNNGIESMHTHNNTR